MARMVRKSRGPTRWASFAMLGGLSLLTWWAVVAIRLAEVPSRSMEPTLLPGDLVLMRIDAYRHRPPARGDIVIFHDPTNKAGLLVKRVVGVAGDALHVQGGLIWLNGQLLREPYLDKNYLAPESRDTVVQKGQLWVMGDNRANSADSRDFGAIETKDLVGRAAAIIWPMARRQALPRAALANAR